MNYILYDLEATCWNERGHTRKSEVIEIGAVKVDQQGVILDEFEAFVRPFIYPRLSKFCTRLTSITQGDVDQADLFPGAIQQFREWIGVGEQDYLLCSWGYFDRDQLRQDSELHGLETKWIERHISIKHQYAEIGKANRLTGVKGALKAEGWKLEGRHHRGIDDARNISRIFIHYLNQWMVPTQ